MSYTPKPGDSVKATLGESTVYGVRDHDHPQDIYLYPLGATVPVYLGSQWTFEPWVKPVVFKPLAVVRLAVDAPFVLWADEPEDDLENFKKPLVAFRSAKDYWNTSPDAAWYEFTDDDIAKALAHGKAEVLFAGVEDDTTGTVA